MGAGSEAVAATMMEYSSAPLSSSVLTIWATLGRGEWALAVDRIAEAVDHAAEQPLADRYVDDRAGALDDVAFADGAVFAEDHDADIVALEVERHALDAARELDHLAGLDAVEAIDAGDAVADRQHLAHFGDFGFGAEVGDLLLENGRDFGGADIHLSNSLHGKLQTGELAADGRIEQARTHLHDETAENVGIDARVDGNLGTAQHRAQRVAELLDLGGTKRNSGCDQGRGLAAAARQLGEEGRGHGRQLAGATVAGNGADEVARQAADANGVEHRQQRLALQLAADDGACDQAGEIGALGDEPAESGEILGDLVERSGIVRQLKKGAGIASGDA